jgi:hypothetical protein
MDDSIKWLGLCAAILDKYSYQIDHKLFESFINNKLLFLLRSLKYL